jgi:hypothetical protein
MKINKVKRSIKTLAVGLIFLMMLAISSVLTEATTCEEAFWKCANDPVNGVIFGGAVYCVNGYIFCKKYIEKNSEK